VIPRIVIAGAASGAGKTTVASGLIGALRAGGLTVQGFKVGPDYIDPSYHALASGRPGRNLDAFLSGTELIAPLVRHGGAGADLAVIEGMMGMFDGASPNSELASTAQIAKLLAAPVLLVLDASAMARSAAAVLHGFASFDPEVNVAGVIFNRVGSDGHTQLLRQVVAPLGIPVLGALGSNEAIVAPERHLGLVPAVERTQRASEALATLIAAISDSVDLAAVERLARSAPALPGPAWSPTPFERPSPTRVAIARGPAFSFHYEENLELLAAAGAELAPFDPMVDTQLPSGTGGLILAGGFPEVFGPELAANVPLREQVRELALAGRPVLAECGGLLYLLDSLDGDAMCGVLAGRGEMAGGLTIGYREARAATATPWLNAETEVRGHEFHHASVRAPGTAAWELSAGGITRTEGIVAGSVQASFLHVHWAAYSEIASRFVRAAAA
jgi:cobyrinic acid a,c-diamide synthase